MIFLRIVVFFIISFFLYGAVLHFASRKISQSPISYPRSIGAWLIIQISNWATNGIIQGYVIELSNQTNHMVGTLLCVIYCVLFLPFFLEGPKKQRYREALSLGFVMAGFGFMMTGLVTLGVVIYNTL